MGPDARLPRRPAAKDSRRFKAPATPTRTRLSTDERRAQLLELGIEAFSERPFDEVSIDDVAQKAGISKGLLYHYFPTKRDFYVETVQSVADDLVTSTDTDPTLGTLTRLVTGLRAYLDFAERHGTVYSGLLRGGIGSIPRSRGSSRRREASSSTGSWRTFPPPRSRARWCGSRCAAGSASSRRPASSGSRSARSGGTI